MEVKKKFMENLYDHFYFFHVVGFKEQMKMQ